MIASIGSFTYAGFPAIGLSFWSILSWHKFSETHQKRWLVFSGLFLGIGATIRWDITIYAVISILASGYLSLLSRTISNAISQPDKNTRLSFKTFVFTIPLKVVKGDLAWIIIIMFLIALSGYVTIGFMSGFGNMIQQVFYFPVIKLHQLRWLPYPPIIPTNWTLSGMIWLNFYSPIFSLMISFFWFVYIYIVSIKKRAIPDPESFMTFSLVTFGLFLFNQALNRSDYIHIFPALMLALMTSGAFVYKCAQMVKVFSIKYGLYILLIFIFTINSYSAFGKLIFALIYFPPWECYSSLDKAGCVSTDKDQTNAIQYIQNQSSIGEPIFVGNDKHDQIYINDIGFYFLSDRVSATRFHELHTGVATTLPVQIEIVQEVENHIANWVILRESEFNTEPNDSGISSGVTYLDDFLKLNYHFVTEFGKYRIFRLNE